MAHEHGGNLSDDDKNNNLEKVAEGEDKLGLPHKATPADIRKGRKSKWKFWFVF